jgi:hypothetical protein
MVQSRHQEAIFHAAGMPGVAAQQVKCLWVAGLVQSIHLVDTKTKPMIHAHLAQQHLYPNQNTVLKIASQRYQTFIGKVAHSGRDCIQLYFMCNPNAYVHT